jgi:hypothetical protein
MSVLGLYSALRRASPASGRSEHRRAPRTKCLLKARCVYNRGCSSLEVLMRDISKTGARICGNGVKFLPNSFELLIQRASGDDERRFARLVWTKGDVAGIAFVAYRPEIWK